MKSAIALLLLCLSLLACGLFSPPAPPTPAAIPVATTTMPPFPTESPAAIPTFPPSVTLSAADFTPILYRGDFARNEFQVIGGVQEGKWLPAGVITGTIQIGQEFDLYAPGGYAGVAVAESFHALERCGTAYIGPESGIEIPDLVGVARGWAVTHRPWKEIAVATPVYYTAVAEWLTAQGFTLPYVKINRIVLVDLEGDGVDEVLISAAYFTDESGHMAEEGDYSIILMRKLVGEEVRTVPVVADLYTNPAAELAFPFTYGLETMLDVNQDGTLELIVGVTRWEGEGAILYEVDGTNVTEALRAVCTS